MGLDEGGWERQTARAGHLRVEDVRAWFPALQSGFAFLENAGGSQVPGIVADAIREYMLTSYVQLGAGYAASNRATQIVDEAHDFMETFVNADGAGKVVLGPSTTALCHILAAAYAPTLKEGDEIVVAETNHEANAGPWVALERYGARIRFWKVDPQTFSCSLENLKEVLSERTRIVALPHVSNLLGQIEDLEAICNEAHKVAARVVADGVAYAPHRAVDVKKWGVDWYVFSTYKVYGPHMAVLYGKQDAFEEIEGPNHFFIPKELVPYKFELGGVSHEGCAGLLALRPYLGFLAGGDYEGRETVEAAYRTMAELERGPQERLLSHLNHQDHIRLIGAHGSCVATISFLSSRESSQAIAERVNRHNIGIRHGNMYAYRLCQALSIDPIDGVVRVSMAHYNSMEEIDRLIAVL